MHLFVYQVLTTLYRVGTAYWRVFYIGSNSSVDPCSYSVPVRTAFIIEPNTPPRHCVFLSAWLFQCVLSARAHSHPPHVNHRRVGSGSVLPGQELSCHLHRLDFVRLFHHDSQCSGLRLRPALVYYLSKDCFATSSGQFFDTSEHLGKLF